MKINILDTYQHYTEMLLLPDHERSTFFNEKILHSFAPMFERMNMPLDPNTIGCLTLSGEDITIAEMLTQLHSSDAWNRVHQAMELSENNLNKIGILTPDEILLGIFLANPMFVADSQGYTGIGSCPGYIIIMIAPNMYNLPRLSSCVAHEFHHNVLFNNIKWNFMNVRLSQYLAIEGLAESFASFLYGKEYIGPWVANIQKSELEKARYIIGQNLNAEGFMEVRKYMYGDHPMVPEGKELGISYCAGYAVGYHSVQAYLRKTSKSVVEATKAFIDGEDIVSQSGYFL